MTLKTLTGPSIRDALADARRLFGADVVMLQSTPAAPGEPASVTVAYDGPPAPARRPAAAPQRVSAPAPARPDPAAHVGAQPYGYAAMRKVVQPRPEPVSAPAPAPRPGPPVPEEKAEPSASAAEVAALRRQLAEVEAVLAELRAAASPPPERAPIVLVGPGGSGKTSIALGLAKRPEVVGARRPAVLIVAPEAGRTPDAAPLFWAAGAPVAVVTSADEVREALALFADADLLLVDTPSLPLAPERARPLVTRLGDVLAPLRMAEVHLVVDATRSAATFEAATVVQTGLRPDVLALTRLDEAPGTADAWTQALGLPLRLVASAPEGDGLALHASTPSAPASSQAAPPPPDEPLRLADWPPSAAAPEDLTWVPFDSPLTPASLSTSVHV